MSLAEWLEEATPDRREVSVCFDRRLLSELVVAREEYAATSLTNKGMLGTDPAAGARVAELEEQVRAKERRFVFEGIGWGAWRDLIAKHPPEPDQAETFARAVTLGFMPHAVENVSYNAESFVPAAMAASCIEPGMKLTEAETLLRKAPPGVIERVWSAVLGVNLAGGDDPFVGAAPAVASDGQRATAKR